MKYKKMFLNVLNNSLTAKTQWIISEHKYPSSSNYATHTGINHFRNNHNEIIVAVVVGGNIFTLNIPLSLLPINSDIRLRIGNSVADIIVFFSNANEGTLQLERCIIDNVEYNTNSAVAFIYGVR